MDTAALASSLVSMQTGARVQQASMVALKQAHAMQQMAVDLLGQAAQSGKAFAGEGVGTLLDKAA